MFWRLETMAFKCHFCPVCKGTGCIGEMPGMGGPDKSANFIYNCLDWSNIENLDPEETEIRIDVRLAPITGAVENIGYDDEKQYYFDMMKFAAGAGYKLSIGDGTPDFKLEYGIEAVRELQKTDSDTKSAVFIKPYPDEKIYHRMEKAMDVAEIFGIDIDSYNIVTMRDLVHLEKKTTTQLIKIKEYLALHNKPLAIKGVFTMEDIQLCKEVRPDIIYISNHGGRVETRKGSTAMFLKEHYKELSGYCDRLWIDGGIRTKEDILTAQSYGVDTVLLGRPFITALCSKTSMKLELPCLMQQSIL